MAKRKQYQYTAMLNSQGELGWRPALPIFLRHKSRELEAMGLLDSGADVNVLPYEIGLELGAIWAHQNEVVYLSGILSKVEARGIILSARMSGFAPVRLAFAWAESDDIPLILGQINFFMNYDICFHRSRNQFELTPAAKDLG